MDNDGDPDLLVSTPGFLGGGGELSWYANDGAGNFDPTRVIISETSLGALAIGDLDGDSDQDLILSTLDDTPLSILGWLENTEQGAQFEFRLPFGFNTGGANDITTLDFDDDGDLDFLIADSLIGQGICNTPIRSFLLADVDVDGRVDVLIPGEGGWLRNQLTGDLDNDGEVGFSDFLILSANFGKSDVKTSDGDLDANGSVEFADFLIFAEQYGNTAERN